MASIQKICKCLQTPALAKRYKDAGVGLGFILGCELLVVPIQIAFDTHSINIPASILVMLFLFSTMTIASWFNGEVAHFYDRHLRGPTDFVGRHMSLGFVTFFILLIQDHIDHASDIPKLAVVFLLTTALGYTVSYLLAYGGFYLETRLRRQKQPANDIESNSETSPSPSVVCLSPSCEQKVVRVDRLSTLSEALSTSGPLAEIETTTKSTTSTLIDWIFRTGPIWIWLSLLATVGLPIYLTIGYMMPFDVFTITLFWVISVQIQRSLRSTQSLLRFRLLRSLTLIFCNPILITWALATAYMYAKAACAGKSVGLIIKDFHHFSTLSKCISHIMKDNNKVPAHLGAGDLAGLLLDAGVACMGFKMYEYRSELWASLVTVTVTCTSLAAISVFVNVRLAHAFHLEAADAIAFAGRSATLALGIPAIDNIGGSTTLASTVAVFSGIVFQMAGDCLFSLLHINDREPLDNSKRTPKLSSSEKSFGISSKAKVVADMEKKMEDKKNGSAETGEEIPVVAAGVTIGINAAAMGTAYLIERDSRAVAYSALSMILFGAVTVALTAIPATKTVIQALISR